MALTYEARISRIVAALNDFLRQFKAPEHMDERTALERIRLTAEAMNKRLPAGIGQEGLADRLSDAFVAVIEKHRGRDWPNVEVFVSAVRGPRPEGNPDADGDMSELSADQLRLLETKILPTARRWLGIPGLREQGEKTLAYWGQE